MSAYGAIKPLKAAEELLPSTIWPVQPNASNAGSVTIHHLTLTTARQYSDLLEYLNAIFAKVIEDGMTYPQEGEIDKDTFEAYFFAADVFIGITGEKVVDNVETEVEVDLTVDQARAGRSWNSCVAGYYYVKPNYPGRSSHICNAGFVVPPNHRGAGYGSILAKSYVHYAPKIGYQASVFNLVYVNNAASIKLWERLGFTKAGKIPRAGRLKRMDGEGEEFVDAWVYYKKFLET